MAESSRHVEPLLPIGGPQAIGITTVTETGSAEVLSFTGGSPGYQTKTITAVTESGSAEVLVVAPRGLVHISKLRGGTYPAGGMSSQSGAFSASGTSENSRVKHVCAADANGIRLLYCNGANDMTTSGVGTITLQAGLEGPTGTIEKVYWSSVDQVDLAVGDVLVSDPVAMTLSEDDVFWVRTHLACASGVKYALPVQTDVTAGDGKNSSASNFAWSGTISASANKCFTAQAILGNADTPCVAVIGDSIEVGSAWSTQPFNGYVGVALSGVVPHVRMCTGGEAAYQFAADHAERGAIIDAISFTDLLCGYTANDMRDSRTVAQIKTALGTIYALFPDANVWAMTRPPYSVTSTDHWTTVANQSRTEVADATRITMNDWFRAGADGQLAGYFEGALAVQAVENPQVWICPDGAATCEDGSHPNSLGLHLMAAAVDTDVFGDVTAHDVSVTEATELGEAQPLSFSSAGVHHIAIEPITEDGLAAPLNLVQALNVPITEVTETGEAQAIFVIHNKTLGVVTEAGAAVALTYTGSGAGVGGFEQIISQLGAEKKIDEPRVYTLP